MPQLTIQTAHPPPEIPGYKFTGEIRSPKKNEYFLPLYTLIQNTGKPWTELLIKDTGLFKYNVLGLIYESECSIDFNNMYCNLYDELNHDICEISVCEVYGKTSKELNLSIPSNYKVIDFRIPRENDIILSIDLYTRKISDEKKFNPNSRKIISIAPRLILKDLKER